MGIGRREDGCIVSDKNLPAPMVRCRVLVDGIVFENSSQIGVWRQFYEYMRRLSDRIDFTLWLRAEPMQPIPEGVRVVRDSGRWYGSWRHPLKRASAEWSRSLSNRRQLESSDVFHSTYFTACPVAGPEVVTTVHDLIAEIAYPYSGGAMWTNHISEKHDSIRESRTCIAVSQSTANDLLRFCPDVSPKLRIIHPGVEHLPGCQVDGSGTSESYALFVGHRDGYKNFVAVLEAMADNAWPVGVSLRVVGAPLQSHEWGLIKYHGLSSRVVDLGRLSDERLASAYAGARCFIFPSRLEGFGLPIVEAQLNRCPVVCSEIPVFREVAGEAAIYFDPRLGDSLAAAVATACDEGVRRRLIESGAQNVGRFSWDRSAEKLLAVYEEAAAAR